MFDQLAHQVYPDLEGDFLSENQHHSLNSNIRSFNSIPYHLNQLGFTKYTEVLSSTDLLSPKAVHLPVDLSSVIDMTNFLSLLHPNPEERIVRGQIPDLFFTPESFPTYFVDQGTYPIYRAIQYKLLSLTEQLRARVTGTLSNNVKQLLLNNQYFSSNFIGSYNYMSSDVWHDLFNQAIIPKEQVDMEGLANFYLLRKFRYTAQAMTTLLYAHPEKTTLMYTGNPTFFPAAVFSFVDPGIDVDNLTPVDEMYKLIRANLELQASFAYVAGTDMLPEQPPISCYRNSTSFSNEQHETPGGADNVVSNFISDIAHLWDQQIQRGVGVGHAVVPALALMPCYAEVLDHRLKVYQKTHDRIASQPETKHGQFKLGRVLPRQPLDRYNDVKVGFPRILGVTRSTVGMMSLSSAQTITDRLPERTQILTIQDTNTVDIPLFFGVNSYGVCVLLTPQNPKTLKYIRELYSCPQADIFQGYGAVTSELLHPNNPNYGTTLSSVSLYFSVFNTCTDTGMTRERSIKLTVKTPSLVDIRPYLGVTPENPDDVPPTEIFWEFPLNIPPTYPWAHKWFVESFYNVLREE